MFTYFGIFGTPFSTISFGLCSCPPGFPRSFLAAAVPYAVEHPDARPPTVDSLGQRRKSDALEGQNPNLLEGILANMDDAPFPPSGVVAARKNRSLDASQEDGSSLEAQLNASQAEIARLQNQLAEERNKSIDLSSKETVPLATSSPKHSEVEAEDVDARGSEDDRSDEEKETLHSSSENEEDENSPEGSGSEHEESDNERGSGDSDSDDVEVVRDDSQGSYFHNLLKGQDSHLSQGSSSSGSQQNLRDPRLVNVSSGHQSPSLVEKSPVLTPVPPLHSIPDDLKDLVSLTPTSAYFFSCERDWRVAEDSLAFPSIEDNGKKMWNFTRGPDNHGLKVSSDLVLEKLVSGKTFLALTERAGKWDQLALDSLFDAEKRKERRKQMMIFLRTKENNCAVAMGGWEASEDGAKVFIDKLPIPLKTLAERKRPARASSPPLAFSFPGKEDSEAQNFLDAVYGEGSQIKDSLGWDDYLNQDRLADPSSTAVLDKLQKDLAQVVRPLQCSLAVADLAEHLGGANIKDTLTRESLKELAQVMGVLSSESAQALLPLADHRAALFEAEKKRLREVAIKGFCPLSIQLDLRQTPVFSGGLFPKKVTKDRARGYKR